MRSAIPAVEVTDNAHAVSVWCPDRKVDALNTVNGMKLCAELFVTLPVSAFGKQMKIKFG